MDKKMNDFIIKKVLESNGKMTNQLSKAIYILTDGTLIDGCYDDDDIRTQEHRTGISSVIGDFLDKDFWEKVHYQFGLVRLVPETRVALIRENQELTSIQKDMLTKENYTIEKY